MIARVLALCTVSAMCLSFAAAEVVVGAQPQIHLSDNGLQLTPAIYMNGTTMASELTGCCVQWSTGMLRYLSSYPNVTVADNYECSAQAQAPRLVFDAPRFSTGVYDFAYSCWSTNATIFSSVDLFNVTVTIADAPTPNAGTSTGSAGNSTSPINATSSTGPVGNTTSPIVNATSSTGSVGNTTSPIVNATSSTGPVGNTTSPIVNATSSTGSVGNTTSPIVNATSSTGASAGSSATPYDLSSSSGPAIGSSTGDSVWLSSSSGAPVAVSSSASIVVSSSSGVRVNETSSTGVIVNGTSSTGAFFNGTSSTGAVVNQTSSTGAVVNGTSSTGAFGNATSSTGANWVNTTSSSGKPVPSASSSTGAASGTPQNTLSARFEIQFTGTVGPADLKTLIRTDLCTVIANQFNTTLQVVDPFCLVDIGTPVPTQARRLLASRIPVTFTLLGNVTSVVNTTAVGGAPARTPMAALNFIQQAIQSGEPILAPSTLSLGIVVPVQEVVVENISPPEPSSSTGLEQFEESSSSSLSGGAIAGIVIGVIAGVVILSAVAYAAFAGKMCFKGSASVGVAHATTTPVHVKATKDAEVV